MGARHRSERGQQAQSAAGQRYRVRSERSDRPPRITSVRYAIHLDSSVPDERPARLVELAERNSTVLGSLRGCGFTIEGQWDRAVSRA